jgi:hypothetical protein
MDCGALQYSSLCTLLVTCFHTGFFLGLFFEPEKGGYVFLRNVG